MMKSSQSATNANAAPAADQKQLSAADSKIEAKLDKTLSGHSKEVHALTMLVDGRLASGSRDETIKLWDMGSGQCVQTLSGHSYGVCALTMLADGRLASGSADNTIKLWDVGRGQSVQSLSGHSNDVYALTVLADGRLASGSLDNTIKLWDVGRGQCVQTLSGHRGVVFALTVLADGRVASGSSDNTIKLWDVQTGQCVQTLSGHSDFVRALTVLADGRLASGSDDKTIKLWDVQTGQCVQTLSRHSNSVYALTVLADGRLASGSRDNTIKLWDVGRGECVQILSGHSRDVLALTMLADGRLASGSDDHTIKFWDVGTQKILQLRVEAQKEAELKKTAEEGRLKAEREAKEKADREAREAREKAEREAREKAEREKREMQDKLAAKDKELAEMKAHLQQLTLQLPNKPATGLSVSFEIPYSELQIGEKLGSGGFGVVYKGKWKFQNVAIKELLDEKPSEKAAAEFKEEMQIMAKLHSENVIRLNGCVLGNPKYCIVMEYMPKGSLFNVLHSNQVLNWWTRYKIATDVASGLAFLHVSNILHRDLKSLNVLLDEHYRAKLTDFGLAQIKVQSKSKVTLQSPSSQNNVSGTLRWKAPELFKYGTKYTQKADIYSLGITFWEIASGKIPFESEADDSIVKDWIKEGAHDDIPENCPLKFVHLIKWCWDTDPAKRPTAVEAMKYLHDSENDFKPFNTDQQQIAPVNVNASAVANSFTVSVRK